MKPLEDGVAQRAIAIATLVRIEPTRRDKSGDGEPDSLPAVAQSVNPVLSYLASTILRLDTNGVGYEDVVLYQIRVV